MLVFAGPTDIQQTTFAVSISFQLVFKWFSTLVRCWQFEQTQQVFSRLCRQFFNRFFNWSSNRFSTSCDWLAVEFSRGVAIVARKKEESRQVKETFYARTVPASVSARGELMVELRRNGT